MAEPSATATGRLTRRSGANITGRPLGEVAGDGGAEAEAAVVSVRTAHFDKLFRDAKHEAGLPHIHFHDSRRKACALRQLKLH